MTIKNLPTMSYKFKEPLEPGPKRDGWEAETELARIILPEILSWVGACYAEVEPEALDYLNKALQAKRHWHIPLPPNESPIKDVRFLEEEASK